jgi:DNA-binding CsgD family transcriptional regulator
VKPLYYRADNDVFSMEGAKTTKEPCSCGCGLLVAPGRRFLRGHNLEPASPQRGSAISEGRGRIRARRLESVQRLANRAMVPLAIADTLGLSVQTVAAYLHDLGIKVAPYLTLSPIEGPEPEALPELSRDREEDVRRLCLHGLVPLAIADVLGVSVSTIAPHLRELEESGEITAIPSYLSMS